MANSPIVTDLPEYVNQQRDVIVSNSVLGAKSAKRFMLQTGVKHKDAINILSTSVSFGDGANCGWDEAGTSTFTQREITTGQVKINQAFCDKKMVQKWMNHKVRIAAGQKTLPFEEEFVNGIIEGVQEKLEAAIWQGDTTSSDVNLKRFDGLVKILNNASDVIDETIASGTSYYNAVKQVLMAMPARTLKEDAVIYCAPEFMRAYMQELVELNYYHFEPGADMDEIAIPGSAVKLVALPGLTGTKKLVGGRESNFYYGTDMEGDEEKAEFWYSQDNREFRLAIEFNAGVQVAFPDEIVLGAYSTLTSPSSYVTTLTGIAGSASTIATNSTTVATNSTTVATNSTAVATNVEELADADHIFKTKEQ